MMKNDFTNVLERVLDRLENVAFLRKYDCLTINDALEVFSGLKEVEVLTLIHDLELLQEHLG